MTIKIIYALLILLMSLACCSCDKVSRQATPKLSGGHEDNAPSCPKLCSGDLKVISYYLESNTPSDPLQVCSPAENPPEDEIEPKSEQEEEARQAEEARKEQLRQEQLARERQTAANARADADVLARAQTRAERGDQERKFKYAEFELDQRQKMFAREEADTRESIRKAQEAIAAARQASADRDAEWKAYEAEWKAEADRYSEWRANLEAELKANADREAEREAQEQAAPRIEAHIKQMYGAGSTATEAEKMEDLENYGYTKLQLRHIVMELNYFNPNPNTPLYKRLSQKISEMPKDMFD
jgi:hypothetical protein